MKRNKWITSALAGTALTGAYLAAIAPSRKSKKDALYFADWDYAHRGLWDMQEDTIPENSLPAFARAVEHGYGIELDVHLTADDRLVVFHDDRPGRMCGKMVLNTKKLIEDHTYAELQEYVLLNTQEKIPLLSEVLDLVQGQVPLLIELKFPPEKVLQMRLCERACEMLSAYEGPYMIESFNPFCLQWLRKNKPLIVRGQLSEKFKGSRGLERIAHPMVAMLMTNIIARPDFIAYRYEHADCLSIKLQSKLFSTPIWVWTVHEGKNREEAARKYDGMIFELH